MKHKSLLVRLKNAFSKQGEKEELLSNFYSTLQQQQYQPKVIFDVGANKGTWTKHCLQFFPDANYILFEPQLNLQSDIKKNLGHHPNVQLFSVGVGNQSGKLLFTYHERDDSCTFNMDPAEATRLGYKQTELPIVALDGFVKENNLPLPDMLKIDAEGLDMEVLQGARELIRDQVEIILVEVGVMNKQFNNSALHVLSFMDSIGFRLFDITDLNRPFHNQVLWLCEFVFIKKGGVLDKNYAQF